ncbi:proteasome adapter and scaffold protein ECM29-like [Ostrea edulis]|uniref:proteasome adapter and scaffold protein ECM29-like n=1 Tax=Ostrea edulis TaxID=37623 RepID=UPI0024AF2504|nr:proteasome adapter and scaffold protein ECM29-like [Ostrea edulis]XP_056020009.1 proteasome adapter and scaffold protein ECM29-like [Ostrea edulis]
MTEPDELSLVERVFLRIGSAESDEQLEGCLEKFLPPVLLKLNSKQEAVRKKVMELLVHVNKRLKSRPKVLLPVEQLIQQYRDPEATSIITNFSIIYIRMGYPRLAPDKQAELVPLLLKCVKGKPKSQQDSIFLLMTPALSYVTMPTDLEKRKSMFDLDENTRVDILSYFMDVLLLPYNVQGFLNQASRPASAPAGDPPKPNVPPAMNDYSLRRVTGDSLMSAEALEKTKLGILKFLGVELFPENAVICHYVVASSDTRHSVATAADFELKKIQGSVDWNDLEIVKQLFSLFQGTVEARGQPPTKPDMKRAPACTRIRLKIFPFFLKSREAAGMFPSSVQVIFDCLYGQNTNAKLKNMAVQFVHHVCFNCSDVKFQPISSVLLSGMMKLITETKDDSRLRSLAYVAVGKIVRRAPQLVKKDIGLAQKLFDAISHEDSESRLAVQESLSLMSSAYKEIDQSACKLMEALIVQNIEKDEPQARTMAVQYAKVVFPADHVPSRYILLLACGDIKEDIQAEARKALYGEKKRDKDGNEIENDNVVLPDFSQIMNYINTQAQQRSASQRLHTVGSQKLPFNPAAYEQMILYLRLCLVHGGGISCDTDSLSSMQDVSPQVALYVRQLLQIDASDSAPVILYLQFIQKLLSAVGGSVSMFCLLELVAVAPDLLATRFVSQLNWIKSYVFSSREDLKSYAGQMLSIVTCCQPEADVLETLAHFLSRMSDKNFEVQQGSILAQGYLIGRYLRGKTREMSSAVTTVVVDSIKQLVGIIKTATELNVTLVSSACLALGEISRNMSLPLPPGEENDNEGEVTKLSILNLLLKLIKTSSQNNKVKERAAITLGQMCVGDELFPFRKKVLQNLMDSFQPKQIELHLTTAEALVFAAMGVNSPAARDMWTQSETDYQSSITAVEDDVEWYLDHILTKSIVSANPHLRQAACIWLLTLVKKCGQHSVIQTRLSRIQSAFMSMLSENDDVTQDIASKGLGMIYEISSSQQKDSLVAELVETLTTGKSSKKEVTGDTAVFDDGAMGKTPDGGGISTYRELCSIANDLNQPDLIYKFMHLANHNAMWNSRKGAAFGFSTIAAQAGEQLQPFLSQIVPKLYRYQFDPNPKIHQAMSSIWNALVKDNKNTVDTYMKEILRDLVMNLTSPQWRIRESSCLAVNDLLRGRPLDDVVEQLPELWETCLRVRDDIKETVRNAADVACRSLSRASIKICDVNYGKMGEKATSLVLPCLLKISTYSPVPEVRAIGLSTLLKISKNAGPLLKPHIAVLVTALLEAVSGLEPQVMNYFSLRITGSEEAQERLDSARIAASKMSPMMETVNYCVQYVDSDVLVELVPRLTDLIKSGIGIGTKAGCSSLVVSFVHHCPLDLTPHAGKLMSAFLSGLNDRNSSIRKSYASALGQLVKVAKDSSVEKLISRLRVWYLEKEEDSVRSACGLTLGAISQYNPDVLKRHAALALPLAFFAMHEKEPEDQDKTEKKTSVWEEVWLDATPGTEAGLRLYLEEVVSLLGDTITSQSWATKSQAAAAMSSVASTLQDRLGPPHLGHLLRTLLAGLSGRTWTGKEALLQAIDTVCTFCREALKNDSVDGQPTIDVVIEAVMKECKKENIVYKMEAMKCMGNLLEGYKVDRFKDMWSLITPVLQSKTEDDDEKSKRELQRESYYEVLGQAWPHNHNTQDEFSSPFRCLLCESLPQHVWKVQLTILRSLYKFVDRYHKFDHEETFKESTNYTEVVSTIVKAITPCIGNKKYSAIRSQALDILELLIKKIEDVGANPSSVLSEIDLSEALQDLSKDVADRGRSIQQKLKLVEAMETS